MAEKGFGSITISNLQDGSQIWTTTKAPVSPNYTFTISDLVGDNDADVKVGDMIFYSTNRYTITTVGTTTVLAGLTQSLKGDTGARGATWYSGTAITGTSTTPASYSTGIASAIAGDHYLNTSTQNVYVCTTGGNATTAKWKYEENFKGKGITSITPQYYLSTSKTAQEGSSWGSVPSEYIDGRYYWTRSHIVWTDGSQTDTTAILDNAMTDSNKNAYDAVITASRGLGMKLNYSAFNTSDSGEVYLHGYTNNVAADVDGYVMWNGLMRTVTKGMINPNNILPYNRYIYIVLRLTSSSSTAGTKYMVWYNSGWKYAVTPTPTQVSGDWTWDEAKDIVLGQFIEPGNEQDVVEAYLYDPPRNASQVKTTAVTPYMYSQSAVEWYNSNGGTTVNATTMLKSWIDNAAFAPTAEINGGYLKAHTIESEHLATDAIMSSNFSASPNPSSPFSATGTFLDLTTGNIYSPNLGVDNTNGKAFLNGEIIATSGRIGNSGANNYWEIGTKTDYNAHWSAALIGQGTAYIQTGNFQLSNGLLNTQMYDGNNKITYLYNNSTYWDFGMQAPQLNTSATGYVAGIDDNWLYIRNHENTIPADKTDWEYLFRVDKEGNIYLRGLDYIKVKNSEGVTVGLSSIVATKDSVGADYLPIAGGTITGNLTVDGTITGTVSKATQLANPRTFITSLESTTAGSFDGKANVTVGISGTLGVAHGGTGATTFTSGQVLIGNGQNAVTTRAITNNTSASYISGSTNLITANTLKFWNGAYDTSHNSNLEYVKLGKLGDVVTHDFDEFITTDGGIIDGPLQVTDLTAGSLIVTGAGRFTNGLYGDLIGNADTATKVNNNLVIKIASGTTEGTNMFTFNGSAAKTVDITKSAIGLGNVENTKLSTWAGSSALTTTKVGTLAGAAVKAVDTSISAGSTSVNLPTTAAVASFVEGKGYVTSSGVTSVRVQATSPVVSSVNTAQSSTLNTTISLADGYGDTKNPYASKTKNYVLAAPSGENGAPTFRALGATDIPALASTLKLAGTNYTASSNVITVTQANLQSAVQSTDYVLMTSAERSKLASIQVSEGGTIDFSGVTASAPLTATVSTDKKVNITHDTSGASVGTYRSVTVDAYGHVTAGTNPTTLSGYGITDAKIASGVITLGSNTITPLTASSTLDATKLSGTASISTTGNATTATKFSSARSITLTGDTTGTASADGSSGWSIATTVSSLTNKVLNSTTINNTSGSFTFSGSNAPWDGTDWVGLQVGSDADKFQIHAKNGTTLEYRQNDSGGTNTSWGDWYNLLSSGNYTDYTVTKTGTGASGTWGINVSGNANSSTYPRIVASNELRFDVSTKPSSATTLYVGYKWSDGTADAKINQYNFYDGNAQLAKVGASTFYGDLSGNATSATKATQDSDGNTISSTYAKLSGATFTGAVTSPYYIASTKMDISSGKIGTLITAPRGGLYSDGVGFTNPATRNDVGWLRVLGTAETDTVFEIATGDDGGSGEQIVARQYNTSTAVVREMKLLDTAGNTSIPGKFTIASKATLEYNSSTASLDFVFN